MSTEVPFDRDDCISDYTALLDAEIWAFIAKTNTSYPPDAVDLSIQQQREVYDRMCATFAVGYPEGVSAVDSMIQAIPIRTYHFDGSIHGKSTKLTKPTLPTAQILYYHGGGFVVGGLESHDDSCAELCARSGLPLTAVDYRLAPEHTHPAAFDDALAAYQYLAANSELPIILMGDSAGATLAAAVAHAVRDQSVSPKPLAQILVYPSLGGDQSKGSYIKHAEAPMLSTKDMQFYHRIVSGGLVTDNDPRLSPLVDTDFSGLPPTTLITAQCDPLSDDGRDYRDFILVAGGQAEWFNEAGLVHGYLRARHDSVRAAASFTRMVKALKRYSQLIKLNAV